MKWILRIALLRFLMSVGRAQQAITLQEWQLQDAQKVSDTARSISRPGYQTKGWHSAIVPGTVLTSLVADGVYPEPLYGENMRSIPESLNKTDYWYRARFRVPVGYRGRRVWVHFGGINYAASVWVNGHECGAIKGAFLRGDFDVTPFVTPGGEAVVAVLVSPQPHPGVPLEHTLISPASGTNGGVAAVDGPTFLSTIGWDWLMGVRDRDTGIWQPVTVSDTGAVTVKQTFVTADLAQDYLSANLKIATHLMNNSARAVNGSLVGVIEGPGTRASIRRPVKLAAHAISDITLSPASEGELHLEHPALWWPNGYGPQNLYHLTLKFEEGRTVSDADTVQFGVRRIAYEVPGSDNLTLSVNGVPVMARGGNWGLDEAMKRVPRKRLEAQFRLHADANLNIIRNWVGQSTNPNFYDLADKYGMLLWDEFFQPNPSDGPDVADIGTYLANVNDKVIRYRNHPSIAVWCARNEGYPPKALDEQLKALMKQLDPQRLYQSNSADGRGVSSHGPYYWRAPRFFYTFAESFKTETGSMSIPTLESIQGMMPQKDWERINDDWAQHDLSPGAQRGPEFPGTLATRYGHIRNLADFARKGAAATYEAFRAMYEGRNAQMFKTTTGVITWMSHPAQPSFVWQLYHYDLEPNAALFAVKKAAETVHIQLNEKDLGVEVVNNRPDVLTGFRATLTVLSADSKISSQKEIVVPDVTGSSTVRIAALEVPPGISPLYFVKLDLRDGAQKLISTNFYWQNVAQDDFTGLEDLPSEKLRVAAVSRVVGDKTILDVSVLNSGPTVAILAHLQVRRSGGTERVLPVFYSDNYFSLVPGEGRQFTVEMATEDLHGTPASLYVDGYNVRLEESVSAVPVQENRGAQPQSWPATQLVP